MHNFFRLLSAGPMFFVSAWLLMLFAGIEHAHVGIHPFGYLTSMVLTIGLWLVVSPAIAAVARGAVNTLTLNRDWRRRDDRTATSL